MRKRKRFGQSPTPFERLAFVCFWNTDILQDGIVTKCSQDGSTGHYFTLQLSTLLFTAKEVRHTAILQLFALSGV